MKETDSSTVSRLLSKLSKLKATGLDKISCRLLRECPDLIAESLSLIFNRSIVMGIFPNEWKCARDHEILLGKLNVYGISGMAGNWFRSYLSERQQTCVINNNNNKFNEDLGNVAEWLSANKLTLNQSKTEFMLIDSCQRIKTLQSVPLLAINGVPVRQVAHTKSLGTYIDENLSWNVHVEKLCKKVASGISALKRIRPFASPTTMQLI